MNTENKTKEKRTDWRKFRKSTHLASADLDIMQSEGKRLVFNIKEVNYEKNVNVSGTKTDGFFAYFKEPVKALKLNTTNLLILSSFTKDKGVDVSDIYIVEKYNDLIIELYVDHKVKHMGKIVDGIRIRPVQPRESKAELTPTHKRWKAAKEAIEQGKTESVLSQFEISEENKKLLGI